MVIPYDKLDEAYRVMCQLNFNNSLKRGGQFSASDDRAVVPNQPTPTRWFSWMDWNYHETCKDAGEIFEMLSFDVKETKTGLLS